MSVDPAGYGPKPAWWGAPIRQLHLVSTTTILLRQTGILECQDFLRWSEAELEAWAAENGVNLWPILLVLAAEGIRLTPNDRPDRLVRLVLSPAIHVARQAVIEYYGLLGCQPRSLQAMGAESPTKQRLLERRLAAARPRIQTLKRLAPKLVPVLAEATAGRKGDPEQVAIVIAPLLGDGQTPPLHFARLLLDAVNSWPVTFRTDLDVKPNDLERRSAPLSGAQAVARPDTLASDKPQAFGEKVTKAIPILAEPKEMARSTWPSAPIEYLDLGERTTNRLKLAGILLCHDLTGWTKEELDFWAADGGVNLAPLMQILSAHAIPLASSNPPDRLVRLLLAPLNHLPRQVVIRYYGLLGHTPASLHELEAVSKAADKLLFSARFRLSRLDLLPPALDQVMAAAAIAQRKREPENLAAAIAPLLGDGQTVPLHFARLLLEIARPSLSKPRSASPSEPTAIPRGADRIDQQKKAAPSYPVSRAGAQRSHELGQRAERTRAATDLIDLLFHEE